MRILLVGDEVAPGVSRISLGRHSIMVGLLRDESGVLLGDDFLHLPQMMQRLIGISRLVTRCQRHGAVILSTSPGRQFFRSPRRARPTYDATVRARQVSARVEMGEATPRGVRRGGDFLL